jgi:tripartite-type tricarboxylate transporter receptor subunit TctC
MRRRLKSPSAPGRTRRRALAGSALTLMVLATALAGSGARALDYPVRPVTLVVPFTPGTGIDIIARALAQRLGATWGQSVVVDNKPGASSNIGTEFVAKAAPDGHVLLVTATSFATNAAINHNLRYDPIASFAPVGVLANGTLSLAISNATPATTVADLVALARRSPGQLNYGSSGNGTPQHLTMELFKLDAKVNITHVPYKGTAGAINDLMGGRLDAMFIPVHTALPYVQQGQMRMIAVISPERNPVVPQVPTMKEAGYPGVQVGAWYAMLAPAGTPAEVVARINADVNAAINAPETHAVLARQGFAPLTGTPARLAELIKAELARWPRVVAAAGIRAD